MSDRRRRRPWIVDRYEVAFDEEEEEEEEESDEEEEEEEVVEVEEEEEGETGTDYAVPDTEPMATTTVSCSVEEEGSEEKGWNREDVDGLFCSICMEPWTTSGPHQPSCLSCGHLFGMSCIKKWLEQGRSSRKCPQCNKKCTLRDVRRIYGSRVVVVEEESQKRIRYLEAKCASLEKKDEEWRKKEVEWRMKVLVWQKREADWLQQIEQLNERTSKLERTMGDSESKLSRMSNVCDGFQWQSSRGHKMGLHHSPVSSHRFVLQQELQLDGARCFDVEDAGQVLIVARRPSQIGGSHFLTKISLVSPHEKDNVLLPSTIRAVRDLHVSPFGRLALLASMGKKLSVVSMESNNIVLNYNLPADAWSCSWDINSSNHVYAGLQNGMLLVFDLRQTERPLESRSGLTTNPIHTVCSLSEASPVRSGVKKLLTASSIGLCQWNIGDALEQPSLITETVNEGVCISLACCSRTDNNIATFRPKVDMSDDLSISQISQAPSSAMGHHVHGSHVLLKRVDSNFQKLASKCSPVHQIRLPKSTILDMGDGTSLFACGDGATSNLNLQELPSLTDTHCLQSVYPIRDVKCTGAVKPSLLCCLSEDRVQLFSQKLL